MKNLTDSLQVRYNNTERVQSDLKDKLSRLKQSIREAREEANKVHRKLAIKHPLLIPRQFQKAIGMHCYE